jgi:hypothetical protein
MATTLTPAQATSSARAPKRYALLSTYTRSYTNTRAGAMLRQPPHLQERLGHEPDQGQHRLARDHPPPPLTTLTSRRPTRNTSRSTGRLAVVALSPSSPSRSAVVPPRHSPSSADTRLPSSTPTGTPPWPSRSLHWSSADPLAGVPSTTRSSRLPRTMARSAPPHTQRTHARLTAFRSSSGRCPRTSPSTQTPRSPPM